MPDQGSPPPGQPTAPAGRRWQRRLLGERLQRLRCLVARLRLLGQQEPQLALRFLGLDHPLTKERQLALQPCPLLLAARQLLLVTLALFMAALGMKADRRLRSV